jgi:TrmH family RNA methyltransferase
MYFMLSKNEVKYIQSLCHKKYRDEEGVFVAEGPKMVEELLRSNVEIVKIYAVSEWVNEAQEAEHIVEVTTSELERISNLQTPNKVLMVAKQKSLAVEPSFGGNISLVLDKIQDPGNMGTIIRIADWFGINQIVASEDTVDVYNSKVVQATMGSIGRVDVWYEDLVKLLGNVNTKVYGAVLDGKNVADLGKIKEGLLVIGNEGKGIRDEVKKFITDPVTIAKIGEAESLNAAVATGIILSHIA